MLLSSKKNQCSFSVMVSLFLAVTSLFFFVCNWTNLNHNLLLAEALTTGLVVYRVATGIKEDDNQLLNGLALLITAIPAVFLLLIILINLITVNSLF